MNGLRQNATKITTIEERLGYICKKAYEDEDDSYLAEQAAIVNDWRYALDALNIEIRTRTIRHRNGTLYCMNCKEYHKDGHAPGCSVGMCIKARDKLSGRAE